MAQKTGKRVVLWGRSAALVAEGPEQSVVRWDDDGREQVVVNSWLNEEPAASAVERVRSRRRPR